MHAFRDRMLPPRPLRAAEGGGVFRPRAPHDAGGLGVGLKSLKFGACATCYMNDALEGFVPPCDARRWVAEAETHEHYISEPPQ